MDRVLSADEALKAFMSRAGAQKIELSSGSYNPILRLENKKDSHYYLQGVYLRKREKANNYDASKTDTIYAFKLISTDAPIVTRNKDKQYVPVTFVKGMEVDVFAKDGLNKQLKGISAGAEVFIQWLGKVPKKTKVGTTITPHTYKVVQIAGPATIQPDDDVTDADVEIEA